MISSGTQPKRANRRGATGSTPGYNTATGSSTAKKNELSNLFTSPARESLQVQVPFKANELITPTKNKIALIPTANSNASAVHASAKSNPVEPSDNNVLN